LKKKTNMKKTT
jgi:hypothetical protein